MYRVSQKKQQASKYTYHQKLSQGRSSSTAHEIWPDVMHTDFSWGYVFPVAWPILERSISAMNLRLRAREIRRHSPVHSATCSVLLVGNL